MSEREVQTKIQKNSCSETNMQTTTDNTKKLEVAGESGGFLLSK